MLLQSTAGVSCGGWECGLAIETEKVQSQKKAQKKRRVPPNPLRAVLGALCYLVTTYPLFYALFFRISFEDPLNTKPIIELSICPKRHIMQLLKSFFFSSVLEFVKNCF